MLSINTNLTSLIAQSSMKQSTGKLNQAIERMTTGFKINHASDNAANYSISTNMTTKLNAYDVAADNVNMGMDLVTTASDIISQMQDKAARLSALSTQARNGTYGYKSLEAINTEASAIMSEIVRLYNSSQYNGVDLFNRTAYTIADHLPQAGESGFIDETVFISATSDTSTANPEYPDFIADPKTYTDAEVAAMTKVADVDTFTNGQKYSISSVEELQKLADYVNSGNNTTGVEFVLGEDIDLSSISNWTPIGDYSTNSSYQFKGTFDGNGHVIKNLTIDNETKNYQGFFGYISQSSSIKNIKLEDINIKGYSFVGGLVGYASSSIENSVVSGTINAKGLNTGGLVGFLYQGKKILNCSAQDIFIDGVNRVGGLVGYTGSGIEIKNCYSTGRINANERTGGILGAVDKNSIVENCYSEARCSAKNRLGGLIGWHSDNLKITNCYSTGDVIGSEVFIGGLIGVSSDYGDSVITNCYSTGNVKGENRVGGLIGCVGSSLIVNSYATGNVSGNNDIGGLIGLIYNPSDNVTIESCISYGFVNGESCTGSLIGGIALSNGSNFGTTSITDCMTRSQELERVGGCYVYANSAYTLLLNYDTGPLISGISDIILNPVTTNLQVGVNSDNSCQLTFDTNFFFDISAAETDISSDMALAQITDFINELSEKQTQLGAVQNRLESALESIMVNIDNLTSSRSTIRDADIAEVSSHYIQQQILQQASATLLATANQSPSIALQLV